MSRTFRREMTSDMADDIAALFRLEADHASDPDEAYRLEWIAERWSDRADTLEAAEQRRLAS